MSTAKKQTYTPEDAYRDPAYTEEDRAKARRGEPIVRDGIIVPGPEENAAITRAALEDPDSRPLDEAWFREAKRGRPPLAPEVRKRQVTVTLDPEVIEGFKAGGAGWQTRMNAALREALGLGPRRAAPRRPARKQA